MVNITHFQCRPLRNAAPFLTNSATVCHLFSTNDLCRLMHFATLNHAELLRNPDFDLAANITLDENGFQRLRRIKSLAFEFSGQGILVVSVRWWLTSSTGSICDCGKPACYP
jgi:hypothetical protein